MTHHEMAVYAAMCGSVYVLHELGHVVAALSLGMRLKSIGVRPWGIFTVFDGGSVMANLLVTLAGPAMNAGLFIGGFFTQNWMFAAINLVCGVAQLIPLPHSDGARVIRYVRQGLAIPASYKGDA
jgi:Zn-dependent protease